MGQASRTIIVHAFDDDDAPKGVGFRMSGLGVDREEIKCDKEGTRPPMHRNDPHHVTFELANRSSVDLRFPPRVSDAIWVSDNDRDCPERAAAHDEFRPQSVSPDGETLKVHNLNSVRRRYKFALNFIDGDNPAEVYSYDPIWDNNNGGRI
jgi:hypothetical protein